MSRSTEIQWCDSSVNPTMGCDGCELWNLMTGDRSCYAGRLHVLRGGVHKGFAPTFEEVTEFPGRMAEAARWSDLTGTDRPDNPWLSGLPRLIFVSDMSDALSRVVTFDYLQEEIIRNVTSDLGRRHQWLWLTKRPERMVQFSRFINASGFPWPVNLWPGTSITTQNTSSRIKHLLQVGDASTMRFLSVEPQRGEIDLSKWLPQLDWVIQGGESGSIKHPFRLEWARDLMRACRRIGVPYFLKQLGTAAIANNKRIKFHDHHGGDWSEWPKDLRVREFPVISDARAIAGFGVAAR